MKLETSRLILRPFTQEDLQDLYEYAQNPKVGPNAGWKPHENLEESQEILNMFLNGDEIIFAVEFKENGKVIGSVGLHRDPHRAPTIASKMLGYVLSADYWGKGLMTETANAVIDFAFTDEKLDLLTCSHFSHNKRSKRVIEKCGFVYEGTLRHAYPIYNGEIMDDCCYSMTRKEHAEMRSKNG